MGKKSLAVQGLPSKQVKALGLFGERICIARKRRRLTLASLAQRMFVDVKTLRRLEKGDPGVSLGVLASALFCLQLEADMEKLAAVETDSVGCFMDKQRLGRQKRIREKPNTELDF